MAHAALMQLLADSSSSEPEPEPPVQVTDTVAASDINGGEAMDIDNDKAPPALPPNPWAIEAPAGPALPKRKRVAVVRDPSIPPKGRTAQYFFAMDVRKAAKAKSPPEEVSTAAVRELWRTVGDDVRLRCAVRAQLDSVRQEAQRDAYNQYRREHPWQYNADLAESSGNPADDVQPRKAAKPRKPPTAEARYFATKRKALQSEFPGLKLAALKLVAADAYSELDDEARAEFEAVADAAMAAYAERLAAWEAQRAELGEDETPVKKKRAPKKKAKEPSGSGGSGSGSGGRRSEAESPIRVKRKRNQQPKMKMKKKQAPQRSESGSRSSEPLPSPKRSRAAKRKSPTASANSSPVGSPVASDGDASSAEAVQTSRPKARRRALADSDGDSSGGAAPMQVSSPKRADVVVAAGSGSGSGYDVDDLFGEL